MVNSMQSTSTDAPAAVMPRVVPDQRTKFEQEEPFKRLNRESEVRYTAFRDRPHEERIVRFETGCREGHAEIAFVTSGTNLELWFAPPGWTGNREVEPYRGWANFDLEHGKVHILSHFILDGVCVRWRGWIDSQRLDGIGWLELDEDRARNEDVILQEQIEQYNRRLREFEERHRTYKEEQKILTDRETEIRKMELEGSESDSN